MSWKRFQLLKVPIRANKERMTVINDLWNKVREGGFMIVSEPGSPMGFRFINDTRNIFINKSRDEANIVAPCPNQLKCPLAAKENLWCNFEQRYERYPKDVLSKEPKEKMDRKGHFSYLVIKKGKVLQGSLNATTPQERSLFWPRVIRPTMIKKGHVIMDMCNTEGEFERRVISKSHDEDGKVYKQARDVQWGDLWNHPRRVPNRFRKTSAKGKRLW
jgi:ribosomal protein RSM22 (predicted rRNA methylase)